MKKKLMQSTLAVALVAAAAFGGAKTYSAYSASNKSDLLTENVEALGFESEGIFDFLIIKKYIQTHPKCEITETYTYGTYPLIKTETKTYPGHYYNCKENEKGKTDCIKTECEKD